MVLTTFMGLSRPSKYETLLATMQLDRAHQGGALGRYVMAAQSRLERRKGRGEKRDNGREEGVIRPHDMTWHDMACLLKPN